MSCQDLFRPRTCNLCKNEMPLEDLRQCSNCGQKGTTPHAFCINTCADRRCRTKNCSKRKHMTCWKGHLPQLEDYWGLHQEIDVLPALYVAAVIHCEVDMEKQRKLHEQDQVAQWFVVKHENSNRDTPRLYRTDRFRDLCNPGIVDNLYITSQFPGFVSFIGNTGVGKSTLLRAMILMGAIETSAQQQDSAVDVEADKIAKRIESLRLMLSITARCPVTRAENIDNLLNPTSYGVHLYSDHNTCSRRTDGNLDRSATEETILFADCEGFRAGFQTTHAESAESSGRRCSPDASFRVHANAPSDRAGLEGNTRLDETRSSYIGPSNSNFLISNEPVTAASYSQKGKEGIEVFYARFLYTISDVIVFVIKSDQSLFTDIQHLLEWALEAVDRSVNGVPYKTLVIVRNMSGLHSEELYNSSRLKTSMIDNLHNLWEGSPSLDNFRKQYNARHRTTALHMQNNRDLFDYFFQDVEVLYVPDKFRAPASQLYEQYKALRDKIVAASHDSQERRAKVWMQYNTPTLSTMLHRAFEHFRTSDRPFDFYKAARNDNPNPTTMPDHIANFLRHIQDVPNYRINMIIDIIAMHLVTWAFRHSDTAVDPDEMFQRDLRQPIQNGFKMFERKDQACGFIFPSGESVCIYKNGVHTRDHCDEKGNRIEGEFIESINLKELAIEKINDTFVSNYTFLCQNQSHVQILPSSQHYRQFRIKTFQRFTDSWERIKSNKTCLSCLQATPDHMLRCGHSFCDYCVRELGRESQSFECAWTLDQCPLCGFGESTMQQIVRLQPICAGVRLLTLDGGGVRGIVELALLEKLDKLLGLGCHLRNFFDLIVGTSTGGIIALGLALKDLTVSEMKDEFLKIATKTFQYDRGGKTLMTLDPLGIISKIFMILRAYKSLYRSTPLLDSLKSLFGEDRFLFSSEPRSVRVAVTTVKDNGQSFCFIGNYNRPDGTNALDFEREDDSSKEFRVFEAGLATSAAPFYFEPFQKSETDKDYIDGALEANMPVSVALDEADRIWMYLRRRDFVLSVGTGIQKKEIHIPAPLKIGGFEKICRNFHNNLNSEQTWTKFRQSMKSTELSNIERLNVELPEPYIALDDHKRMHEMYEKVDQENNDPKFQEHLRDIADRMLAGLFFFEPDYIPSGPTHMAADIVRGSIRCRLAKEDPALRELLPRISTLWYGQVQCNMSKYDQMCRQGRRVEDSVLEKALIDASTKNQFFRVPITLFRSSGDDVELIVSVVFKRNWIVDEVAGKSQSLAISGFPETFENIRRKARRSSILLSARSS